MGDLRFYKVVNPKHLLNLPTDDEEAIHDASDIRARILNCFTSSQSRYLELRLHPDMGDLRFYKVVAP